MINMPCSCCGGLLKLLAQYGYTEELSFFVVEERKVAIMNIKHRRGRNKNENKRNKRKIKQPTGGGGGATTNGQKEATSESVLHTFKGTELSQRS